MDYNYTMSRSGKTILSTSRKFVEIWMENFNEKTTLIEIIKKVCIIFKN